jgi:hypothetical protein
MNLGGSQRVRCTLSRIEAPAPSPSLPHPSPRPLGQCACPAGYSPSIARTCRALRLPLRFQHLIRWRHCHSLPSTPIQTNSPTGLPSVHAAPRRTSLSQALVRRLFQHAPRGRSQAPSPRSWPLTRQAPFPIALGCSPHWNRESAFPVGGNGPSDPHPHRHRLALLKRTD